MKVQSSLTANFIRMKAIIYSRVSSTTDRQNTERQISDLNRYAIANDIEVTEVFSEHISGAKSNRERITLTSALEFAKSNGIDIVLFSELSRLGRNVLEVTEIIKWFSDNHVNAYFQKENLTLLNADGKVSPTTTILVACLGMVAEIERDNIKYRLNSGRSLAIEKGVKMGRKVGSVESREVKESKYPVAIRYIKKGYKLTEVLAICKQKGEKISNRTLMRLKKEIA